MEFLKKHWLTIIIVLTLLLAGIFEFYYSKSFVETTKVVSSLALILSMIIALNLYISTTTRHNDEDKRNASKKFLDESINLLERIYETFTYNDETRTHNSLPRTDRYLWLTVARMILKYEKIKNQITDPYDKIIIQEHEEYWRFRLYNIFNQHPELSNDYFSGGEELGEELEYRSILVVFDFMKWKDGIEDPIDEVNAQELYNQGVIPLDQPYAEFYIRRLMERT